MMPQSAIFAPFFAALLLTAIVWSYMYFRRIAFVRASGADPEEFRSPEALNALAPAEVSNPSDNLKNLFEIPVIFYALCLYLFVTGSVDGGYVAAAWTFVFFRGVHSLIHCTCNRVLWRFCAYFASTLAVWFMLLKAVVEFAAG